MAATTGEAELAEALREFVPLVAEVRNILKEFAEHAQFGQTQTVIHKTEGSGILAGICVACVVVVLGFIIIENRSFSALQRQMDSTKKELQDDLRDAKAWNEVLRGKVSKLEAQQSQEKKP